MCIIQVTRRTLYAVKDLEQAIYKWLAQWNGLAALFVWKASADVILDRVRRCKELTRTGVSQVILAAPRSLCCALDIKRREASNCRMPYPAVVIPATSRTVITKCIPSGAT